jgi:hypothetical protein
MAFEKYDKGTGRGTNEPRISLRRSDTLGINGPAVAECFEDVDGVILYHDDNENRVGLEPADADDTDAYTLVENNNADSATVNATGFMTSYGLTPDQTTHYEAPWEDDQELVFIDLDEPVKSYGSPDDEE